MTRIPHRILILLLLSTTATKAQIPQETVWIDYSTSLYSVSSLSAGWEPEHSDMHALYYSRPLSPYTSFSIGMLLNNIYSGSQSRASDFIELTDSGYYSLQERLSGIRHQKVALPVTYNLSHNYKGKFIYKLGVGIYVSSDRLQYQMYWYENDTRGSVDKITEFSDLFTTRRFWDAGATAKADIQWRIFDNVYLGIHATALYALTKKSDMVARDATQRLFLENSLIDAKDTYYLDSAFHNLTTDFRSTILNTGISVTCEF